MNDEHMRWEPVAGVDSPCADISFSWRNGEFKVVLHFSHVRYSPIPDLELAFRSVAAVRYYDEFHGSIVGERIVAPPHCRSDRWSRWVYPMLRVNESTWLKTFSGLPGFDPRLPGELYEHYHFVSMNDLLEIVAMPNPVATWLRAQETGPPSGAMSAEMRRDARDLYRQDAGMRHFFDWAAAQDETPERTSVADLATSLGVDSGEASRIGSALNNLGFGQFVLTAQQGEIFWAASFRGIGRAATER